MPVCYPTALHTWLRYCFAAVLLLVSTKSLLLRHPTSTVPFHQLVQQKSCITTSLRWGLALPAWLFLDTSSCRMHLSACSNNSCVSIAIGNVLSLPACVFGKIKRALAVDRGKCQTFLWAWTHNRFTSFNSLSDHLMSAAEKRKTPIPPLFERTGALHAQGLGGTASRWHTKLRIPYGSLFHLIRWQCSLVRGVIDLRTRRNIHGSKIQRWRYLQISSHGFDSWSQHPEIKISPDFIIVAMSSRTTQSRVSSAFHAAFSDCADDDDCFYYYKK